MKKPIELDYINVDMPEAKDYFVFLHGEIAGYGTEAKAGKFGWVNVWNPRDSKEYTLYGDVEILEFNHVLDWSSTHRFIDIDECIREQEEQEATFQELVFLDTGVTPYWWIYVVVWNGKIIADVFSATAGSRGRVNAWKTSSDKGSVMYLNLDTVVLDGQVRIITRQKAKELNLQEVYAGDI